MVPNPLHAVRRAVRDIPGDLSIYQEEIHCIKSGAALKTIEMVRLGSGRESPGNSWDIGCL